MKSTFEIIFLPDAAVIDIDKQKYYIKWNEIFKVVAYKKDLVAIDLICIDIYINDLIVTVSEDFYNWEKFIHVMNSKLNIQSDWLPAVAHPPFEINQTVLFDKDNTSFNHLGN